MRPATLSWKCNATPAVRQQQPVHCRVHIARARVRVLLKPSLISRGHLAPMASLQPRHQRKCSRKELIELAGALIRKTKQASKSAPTEETMRSLLWLLFADNLLGEDRRCKLAEALKVYARSTAGRAVIITSLEGKMPRLVALLDVGREMTHHICSTLASLTSTDGHEQQATAALLNCDIIPRVVRLIARCVSQCATRPPSMSCHST